MPANHSTHARSTPASAALLLVAMALALCAACARPVPVGGATTAARSDSGAADPVADGSERTRPGSWSFDRAEASEWRGRSVQRVEELFAGRFPGVQVYQTAQGIAVRVRGEHSFTGNGAPLYVIDGFPIEAGPGGLVSLNPADVASIQVLKDAGSLAFYGVRGANGVILITTRRGR